MDPKDTNPENNPLTPPQGAAPVPADTEVPRPAPNTPVDIGAILLPKKEPVVPGDAQRINAAALLAQEQAATLAPQKPEESAPAPAPAPAEESVVRPLQTYRGDIEKVIDTKQVSVVSIAAAEADRTRAPAAAAVNYAEVLTRWGMYLGGVLLIGGAAAAVTYVALIPRSVPVSEVPQAPFIAVDHVRKVEAKPTRAALMQDLVAAKQSIQLSLGLVAQIFVTQNPDTEMPSQVPGGVLLSLLAPELPEPLLRTLEPTFLLGVHSFDSNEPFLILSIDSYETAFAGMLAWEITMQEDLAPLFDRVPRPRIPEEGLATSTPPQGVIGTRFVDRVVENREARAIVNEYGDLLLLWAPLDRRTFIVATNEYTLREVLSRRHSAPIVPIPQ